MNSIAKYVGIFQIQVDFQDFFLVSLGNPYKANKKQEGSDPVVEGGVAGIR